MSQSPQSPPPPPEKPAEPALERHHVETYPAEAAAPEIVPAPIHPEPGGHVQSDDVNVSMVAIVGVFAAILLFLLIVLLQAWFYAWTEHEQSVKSEPSAQLIILRSQQEDQLKDYHWVDQANHVRGLTIERAMELEARQLAGDQARVPNTGPAESGGPR